MTSVATPPAMEDFERFAADDPTVDRHDLFRRCRHDAPLFFSPRLDAWVLSRYDDVKGVLADEDRYATLREGPGAPVYGPSILQWQGREHQKKGGIVARRLRSPKAVESFDAFVADTARRVAEEVATADGPVDLKSEYAMWIPLLAIGELLGIEDAHRFREWYDDIAAGGVSSIGHPEKRARAFEAVADLKTFLDPIIAERRESPGEDLLSDLCTATYDGEPLPVEQILAFTAFLLTAGVETTERALSSLFVHLFSDPARWQALRDDPSLIGSVIAETLRVFPPVHGLTRRATQDVEVHGTHIAEGSRLVVLLASANRDESVFDEPDTFAFDRFTDAPERQFTNAGTILPFGAGRHHCTGSQLARTELLHGVGALVERVAGATFVNDTPPQPEGFLLVSPSRVDVTLQRA